MNSCTGREKTLDILARRDKICFPRFEDMAYILFPGDRSPSNEDGNDWWGVRWLQQPPIGQMTDEKAPHVITNIEEWRKELIIPNPEKMFDWEQDAEKLFSHWNRETQIGAVILSSGHFERLTTLVGFQEALISFYDEDVADALHELFEAITEYKIQCIRLIKKYISPDIVVYHDDWGNNSNLMFSPEHWRDFIKPELKKIVDAAHECGLIFEMHSDGHVQELIGDLVNDIGIDIIQPLQYPQNDIRMIKERYGNNLVIRGGLDGQLIMRADVCDDSIRASIRECLSVLAPGGNYLPYFTRIGIDVGRAVRLFNEELDKYEDEVNGK